MKFNKKLEDLKITLKSFNKDDLLVIFVPTELFCMNTLDELREVAKNLKIENSTLFFPGSFDVKKINFTGIEGKKVDKIDIEDDIINIGFVEKR